EPARGPEMLEPGAECSRPPAVRESHSAPYAERVEPLPDGQVGFFRRGDSARVVGAWYAGVPTGLANRCLIGQFAMVSFTRVAGEAELERRVESRGTLHAESVVRAGI